jgi:catechol 2,3-dioxygenase-like lactoylglutathione lyase family enzyme
MSDLKDVKPIAFILTRDREKLVDFYENVLGLRRLGHDQYATSYDLGGVALRLTVVEDHSPSPHPVLGWAVADMAATVATLGARGVRFTIYPGFGQDETGVWTSPDGAYKLAWFPDPEGNVLSLTQR